MRKKHRKCKHLNTLTTKLKCYVLSKLRKCKITADYTLTYYCSSFRLVHFTKIVRKSEDSCTNFG